MSDSTPIPPAAPRRALTPRSRHELEFLPAAIEIIETPVSPAGRLTMATIVALLSAAIAWACLGKVDIIATANGRIIPSGKVKVIQPLEIGVVKAIRIADGQRVHVGDVLIELDSTTNAADQDRVARDLAQSEIDVARLNAFLAGNASAFAMPLGADAVLSEPAQHQLVAELMQRRAKLDGLDRQIAGKSAERDQAKATVAKIDALLPLLEEKAQLYEKIRAIGYVSKVADIDAHQALVEARNNRAIVIHQLDAAEAGIAALVQSRLETEAEFRLKAMEELSKANQKLAELRQDQVKASQRTLLQVLRAPVDGVVEQLSVHTVGGVVTPAQPLLTIVPDDSRLEVEAMLPNREVGFVQAGQRVEIKVEAFTYTRYGLLQGRIESVSRDVLRNERTVASGRDITAATGAQSDPGDPAPGESVYVARVSLNEVAVDTEQGRKSLEPGMAVTAEIKTGKRRIIEYLLSPLLRYRHEALKER